MKIADMTMDEFEKALLKTKTLLLPVGSLEEHGSHLPVGTDAMHASAIAEEVERLIDVFVAPPLWYGLCRSTSQHTGTVSISGKTLRGVIYDIVCSFYKNGLQNQIVLSGHAGGTHMAFIVDALEEAIVTCPALNCCALSIIDIVRECCSHIVETPNDSHAGEVETSIIKAIAPELVKGIGREEYPSFPKHFIVRDKKAFWPGGIWGRPEASSKEKGASLLRQEASYIVGLIKELEKISSESCTAKGGENKF